MQTFFQCLFLFLLIGIIIVFICKLIEVIINKKEKDNNDLTYYIIGIPLIGTMFFFSLKEDVTQKSNLPVIIWNDDLESIPIENSLITLEMVKNDTIYIGSYDNKAKIN